jgi:hypothetical protein
MEEQMASTKGATRAAAAPAAAFVPRGQTAMEMDGNPTEEILCGKNCYVKKSTKLREEGKWIDVWICKQKCKALKVAVRGSNVNSGVISSNNIPVGITRGTNPKGFDDRWVEKIDNPGADDLSTVSSWEQGSFAEAFAEAMCHGGDSEVLNLSASYLRVSLNMLLIFVSVFLQQYLHEN